MGTALEQKKQIVEDIATKLRESKGTILVDYRGLDVAAVTELRKQLREAGCEFKVYKNTLARRATQAIDLTELDQYLVGPTAMAFSPEDAIAAAKILHKFAKDHEELEIKAGVVEGQIVTKEKVEELADLPSREGLLAMLLSVLQAPVRNFALVVKAVAEKKEEAGEQAQA
ncbi:50S ribosomal protein L10 [Caldalkalibacillus thermarum TA2.A1]|uniref:Large ribosomal subunit protein uL10 n=1 Tax=Caldalkalibacillus thermarum (strain TA2.A1) TaxID=986075 RepID=F5L358_CALTT|nr:50S ribosomal protein L10 [Caldalkalibacillus thermarum]EGL84228.1 50S ribosomal protein L10 [Caldalkalibacillus thermarum TA2.A1]QZT34410.1 50S ribosomal protein L10 [Caldalkalibacillus thermarum TA2.A1]